MKGRLGLWNFREFSKLCEFCGKLGIFSNSCYGIGHFFLWIIWVRRCLISVWSLLVMAALCNRGAIIFLPCNFYFLSIYLLSSFFPPLISAAAGWMSTILWHMVWPYCEFRMQVWNVLHTARCKYGTQKSRQKSPSGHHRTTLLGYIFATTARIDNRKNTC